MTSFGFSIFGWKKKKTVHGMTFFEGEMMASLLLFRMWSTIFCSTFLFGAKQTLTYNPITIKLVLGGHSKCNKTYFYDQMLWWYSHKSTIDMNVLALSIYIFYFQNTIKINIYINYFKVKAIFLRSESIDSNEKQKKKKRTLSLWFKWRGHIAELSSDIRGNNKRLTYKLRDFFKWLLTLSHISLFYGIFFS